MAKGFRQPKQVPGIPGLPKSENLLVHGSCSQWACACQTFMKHQDHVQGASKKGFGVLTAPIFFMAWGHQAYVALQLTYIWPWTTEGVQASLTIISDRELQVDTTILGQSLSFLLDTGAPFAILTEFLGPTSPCSSIVRVGG